MAWLCGLGSPNNRKADRYFNWTGDGREKSYFREETKKSFSIAWESEVEYDVALFSASPSWGLSFESQSPTRRYYLTDYEPVISLPSSLRKADLMWQIQGPRWQISQEFALISTTHIMVRLPHRQEMWGYLCHSFYVHSAHPPDETWINIRAWPRKTHDWPAHDQSTFFYFSSSMTHFNFHAEHCKLKGPHHLSCILQKQPVLSVPHVK